MTRTFISFLFAIAAVAFHPAAFADHIGGGKPDSSETTTQSSTSWFDSLWLDSDTESDTTGE